MNFLFKLLTWCHRLACSRYNQLLYYLKTRHLYILKTSEVGGRSYQTLLFKLDMTDMVFPFLLKLINGVLKFCFVYPSWESLHFRCFLFAFSLLLAYLPTTNSIRYRRPPDLKVSAWDFIGLVFRWKKCWDVLGWFCIWVALKRDF